MIRCRSKKGRVSLYTGYTNSIERRLEEHSSGKGAKYTQGMKLKLVFYQTFRSQKQAMRREREIKGFTALEKKALVKNRQINEYFQEL
ncbi:MAG: GIY-YIG nuclease family protein [Promethearchaeota archaeon]